MQALVGSRGERTLKGTTAMTAAAMVMVAVTWMAVPPAQAATCSDYSTQAEAQRAADTRDADGDGVYCESLPCPCARPGSGGGDPAPRPRPRRDPSPEPAPEPRRQRIAARITRVIDGDTLRVSATGARRSAYTVRLIGIDTPETVAPNTPVECGGPQATSNLLRLAFSRPADTDGDGLLDEQGGQGRRVTLLTDPSQDTFDRYGRLLAYVTTRSGRNLALEQLAAGWAKVYVYERRFAQYGRFRAASARARSARRGAWDACGGNFHQPS